jgi:hypothetical protein
MSSHKKITVVSAADKNRQKLLSSLEYKPFASSASKQSTDAGEVLKGFSKLRHGGDAVVEKSLSGDEASLGSNMSHTVNSHVVTQATGLLERSNSSKKTQVKKNHGFESKFETHELWSPVSKVLSHCSVAFSEASIASASSQGMYDAVSLTNVHIN